MEEQELAEIASYFKKEIIEALLAPRPVTSYSGQIKTIGGNPIPEQNKIASGEIINELNVYWAEGFFEGVPELVVEMPLYYYFIEQGRKPGRYPPLDKIRKWSLTKANIPRFRDKRGRFISNDRRTFLMARSIARYGTGPYPFLDVALENALPKIVDNLGDAAATYLQTAINENRLLVGL